MVGIFEHYRISGLFMYRSSASLATSYWCIVAYLRNQMKNRNVKKFGGTVEHTL